MKLACHKLPKKGGRCMLTSTLLLGIVQSLLFGDVLCYYYNLKHSKKVDLSLEKEDIVNVLESVEGYTLILLTYQDWLIYDVRDKSKDVVRLPHNIQNLKADHMMSIFSHTSLFCFTKDVFYIFHFGTDVEFTGFKYTDAFPITYFPGVKRFGPHYAINDWNNTIIVSTSDSTLHVFDLRDLKFPKSRQLILHHNAGKEIMDLENYNLGKSIAVRYRDSNLQDSIEVAYLQSFNKARTGDGDLMNFKNQILSMLYDTYSNSLIILQSTDKILRVDCTTNTYSDLALGLNSFADDIKLFETGMRYFLMIGPKHIDFVDMDATPWKIQATLSDPDPEFEFLAGFFLSPYILTWKQTGGKFTFRDYSVGTDDTSFFHPTCKYSLQSRKPFEPCSQKSMSLIGIVAAMICLLMLILTMRRVTKWCVLREEKTRFRRKLEERDDYYDIDSNNSLVAYSNSSS